MTSALMERAERFQAIARDDAEIMAHLTYCVTVVLQADAAATCAGPPDPLRLRRLAEQCTHFESAVSRFFWFMQHRLYWEKVVLAAAVARARDGKEG